MNYATCITVLRLLSVEPYGGALRYLRGETAWDQLTIRDIADLAWATYSDVQFSLTRWRDANFLASHD